MQPVPSLNLTKEMQMKTVTIKRSTEELLTIPRAHL